MASRRTPKEPRYEQHQCDDGEPHGYADQDRYRDTASRCQIVRLIAVRLTVALCCLVGITSAIPIARGGGRAPRLALRLPALAPVEVGDNGVGHGQTPVGALRAGEDR